MTNFISAITPRDFLDFFKQKRLFRISFENYQRKISQKSPRKSSSLYFDRYKFDFQ